MDNFRLCKICGITKPINDFHFTNKDMGYRSHRCKKCHNQNKRKFSLRNKAIRRIKRKKALKKMGNKCLICGFSDFRALEIDHITAVSKTETKRESADAMVREVLKLDNPNSKYQLLCANCHRIKTYEKQDHLSYSKSNHSQVEIILKGREIENKKKLLIKNISKISDDQIIKLINSRLSLHYWSEKLDISEDAVSLIKKISRIKIDPKEEWNQIEKENEIITEFSKPQVGKRGFMRNLKTININVLKTIVSSTKSDKHWSSNLDIEIEIIELIKKVYFISEKINRVRVD